MKNETTLYRSMVFSENLNSFMKRSSLSQLDVAKKTGIAQPTISNYCNGKTLPNLDTLTAICVGIGCSADYLLGLSQKNLR